MQAVAGVGLGGPSVVPHATGLLLLGAGVAFLALNERRHHLQQRLSRLAEAACVSVDFDSLQATAATSTSSAAAIHAAPGSVQAPTSALAAAADPGTALCTAATVEEEEEELQTATRSGPIVEEPDDEDDGGAAGADCGADGGERVADGDAGALVPAAKATESVVAMASHHSPATAAPTSSTAAPAADAAITSVLVVGWGTIACPRGQARDIQLGVELGGAKLRRSTAMLQWVPPAGGSHRTEPPPPSSPQATSTPSGGKRPRPPPPPPPPQEWRSQHVGPFVHEDGRRYENPAIPGELDSTTFVAPDIMLGWAALAELEPYLRNFQPLPQAAQPSVRRLRAPVFAHWRYHTHRCPQQPEYLYLLRRSAATSRCRADRCGAGSCGQAGVGDLRVEFAHVPMGVVATVVGTLGRDLRLAPFHGRLKAPLAARGPVTLPTELTGQRVVAVPAGVVDACERLLLLLAPLRVADAVLGRHTKHDMFRRIKSRVSARARDWGECRGRAMEGGMGADLLSSFLFLARTTG